MQSVGIVFLCIGCAIGYGILHDLITTRICVEYFTIGHPPIFGTEDPTLLALGWGTLATWWVGLILGVPLAGVARWGPLPKRSTGSLIRSIVLLLLTMAAGAALCGVIGWILASNGAVYLVGRMAQEVPPEKHAAFLADLWAHSASYAVGFLGGFLLIVRVAQSRFARTQGVAGSSGDQITE